MLRRRKNARELRPGLVDDVDEMLLAGIDASLSWRLLLVSAPCPEDEAEQRLMRLVELGVLEVLSGEYRMAADTELLQQRPMAAFAGNAPSVYPAKHQTELGRSPHVAQSGHAPDYVDEELREELDHIENIYGLLDEFTHYQVLGVPMDATSEQVRRAYFELAKRFHPDAFFRKPLGPFREKLQTVFTALTQAHDVLRSPKSRSAYDRSLGIFRAPHRDGTPATKVAVRAAHEQAGRVAPSLRSTPSERAPSAPSRAPTVSMPVASTPAPSVPLQSSPSVSEVLATSRTSEPPTSALPISVTPSARFSVTPTGATFPSVPTGNKFPSIPAAGKFPSIPTAGKFPTISSGTSLRPPSMRCSPAETRASTSASSAPRAPTHPPPSGSGPKSMPTGVRSLPPSANTARDALMRELLTRRGGATTTAGVNDGAPKAALHAVVDELSRGDAVQKWAASHLHQALQQEQSGDLAAALTALSSVLMRVPDPRIRELRDSLHARTLKAAVGDHRARAMEAEESQDYRRAAEHWRKVFEAAPTDAYAALHGAICCMEARDIKQAGQHAKRAVELAPNDPQARRILLRCYELMGMTTSADNERKALEKLQTKA